MLQLVKPPILYPIRFYHNYYIHIYSYKTVRVDIILLIVPVHALPCPALPSPGHRFISLFFFYFLFFAIIHWISDETWLSKFCKLFLCEPGKKTNCAPVSHRVVVYPNFKIIGKRNWIFTKKRESRRWDEVLNERTNERRDINLSAISGEPHSSQRSCPCTWCYFCFVCSFIGAFFNF